MDILFKYMFILKSFPRKVLLMVGMLHFGSLFLVVFLVRHYFLEQFLVHSGIEWKGTEIFHVRSYLPLHMHGLLIINIPQ